MKRIFVQGWKKLDTVNGRSTHLLCGSLSEQCAFEQQMLSEDVRKQKFSLTVFLFWVFFSSLSTPAHFSDWFNSFFFHYLRLAFLFLPPLLSIFKPFWHFVCVCLTVSLFPLSFSLSPSLIHLLSLPPLSASFHLFLYLSQWELMWPLCAVSSLRGRQSSSAPIRTALSGAVSTTSPQKKRKEKKKPIPPSTYATHRSRGGKRRRREKKSQWH